MVASAAASKESYTNATSEVLMGAPVVTEEVIKRYFNPGYGQITDCHVSDYAAFVKHIMHLRGTIESGEVVVHDFLRDGNQIAERHNVTCALKGGKKAELEGISVGTLDGRGRLEKVMELTRQVGGRRRRGIWGGEVGRGGDRTDCEEGGNREEWEVGSGQRVEKIENKRSGGRNLYR